MAAATTSTTGTSSTITSKAVCVFSFDHKNEKFNQYWYSPKTVEMLLAEVLHHATRAAFLSTPSLFFALDHPPPFSTCCPCGGGEDTKSSSGSGIRNSHSTSVGINQHTAIATTTQAAIPPPPPQVEALEDDESKSRREALRKQSTLFEFDTQWKLDPNFVFYDFRKPDQIPVQHLGQYDYVIADPPFITEDVWTAYVETAQLLLSSSSAIHKDNNNNNILGTGKVLFTTVLENHMMLEFLLQGPLYIPRFRPLVHHLTYQYVCFTNYVATKLNETVNDEVELEEEKILAAIEMANNIRMSEETFAVQMQTRLREASEELLPTVAYQKEKAEREKEMRIQRTKLVGLKEEDGSGGGDEDKTKKEEGEKEEICLDNLPLEQMPWGRLPESLRAYLASHPEEIALERDGEKGDQKPRKPRDGDNNNHHAQEEVENKKQQQQEEENNNEGEIALVQELRHDLDEFKGRIDRIQKVLHEELQRKIQVLKKRKELMEEAERRTSIAAAATSTDPLPPPSDSNNNNNNNNNNTDSHNNHATTTTTIEGGETEKKNNISSPALVEALEARDAVRQRKLALLEEMSQIAERIQKKEEHLAVFRQQQQQGQEASGDESTGSSASPSFAFAPSFPSYLPILQECVERYRAVEIKKSALLELASSATGRYKAPLFGRMKALLQEMKAFKK